MKALKQIPHESPRCEAMARLLWDTMKRVYSGREKKDVLKELCNSARVIVELVRLELDYCQSTATPPNMFLSGPGT